MAVEVQVDEEEFARCGDAQKRKLRSVAKRLRDEPFLGDRIRRSQIPKKMRDLPNLFRIELPGAWRALYTVASYPGKGTVVRFIWIGDHKRYDRLFQY